MLVHGKSTHTHSLSRSLALSLSLAPSRALSTPTSAKPCTIRPTPYIPNPHRQDELQLLPDAASARASKLRTQLDNASVCFWETPLPLDISPRLLVLPERGAADAVDRTLVRIWCGGFPIIDTGPGRVVVNVCERLPPHVLEFRRERARLNLQGEGAAGGEGEEGVGAGVLGVGMEGEAGAVCNHDVVAEVIEGGEACQVRLPVLQTTGDVDVAFSVSCDGAHTFSAPCPTVLQVRQTPRVRDVSPRLASTRGGTRLELLGAHLSPRSSHDTVWVRFSTQPPAGDRQARKNAGKVLQWKVQGAARLGGTSVECYAPYMRELAGAAPTQLFLSVSVDSGAQWCGCGGASDSLSILAHGEVVITGVSPPQVPTAGGAKLMISGTGLFAHPSLRIRLRAAQPLSEALASEAEAGRPLAVFGGKYSAGQQAIACVTPAVDFVGEVVVEVSFNDLDWYAAPGRVNETPQLLD